MGTSNGRLVLLTVGQCKTPAGPVRPGTALRPRPRPQRPVLVPAWPQVFMERRVEGNPCPPNMIWILENANPIRGGGLKFGVPYRVRHLASSAYLTVVDQVSLAVSTRPECTKSTQNLFVLCPLDADDMELTPTTPVRLKHQSSGGAPGPGSSGTRLATALDTAPQSQPPPPPAP